jgi:isopentenyldiphosphate isomerase
MFVLAKKKDEKRWQVQIVESVRVGKSIRQKIVRNIGTAYSEKEVAEFKRIGEASIVEMNNAAKPVLSIFDPAEFHSPRKRQVPCDGDKVYPSDLKEEKRFNEGISDIFGKVYEDLGFDRLIQGTSKDREWNDILQSSVLARIAEPDSKRATSRFMDEEFDIKIPVQKIYRMMDLLSDIEGKIKQTVAQKTLAIFEEEVDVLFFDVTTLYFESIERDELRNFGFSKDCKFNQSQVMLALVTTHEGLPISYQLFPGNTFEGHTLLHMVKELKESFKVSKITLVADRGMFTRDNLAELEKHEIQYVVAAKLKSFSKAKKDEILNSEFKPTCVNNEFHWVRDFENDGRRLVVSNSSSRAKKDASDRQRLVDRLLKKVSPGKEDIKIGGYHFQ